MNLTLKNNGITLVYPQLGLSGSLVRHIPLSLLYAAIDSLKAGFRVNIVDTRLVSGRWQEACALQIDSGTVILGISVMTGTPIKHALDISRWAKREYPDVKVVWGGPHPTFNGEEILREPSIDYVIRGYGSKPLALLAARLSGQQGAPEFSEIAGLIYRREGGVIRVVPPEPQFEMTDWRDIPYHLVRDNLDRYDQLDTGERIFSMYSAMGCPYQCSFCSSPAQYRPMRKKYIPLPPEEVADHVAMVCTTYGATYIYFIDDDSFVDPGHVEAVIDAIRQRGLDVRMGFRGARISELKGMSDAFLQKLSENGTNILHIGAESGSQRILDLCNKKCTVEDIIEVNQKMARHPEIRAAYNWILGLPGETADDLRLTRELMLRIIKDNPSALVFTPNQYRPLPGTELYRLALTQGFKKPERLEDWVEIEVEGNYRPPWIDEKLAGMIHMMQVASYFIDDKLFKVPTGDTWKFRLLRILAKLYKPFAMLRFRHGVSAFLLEYKCFHLASSFFRN